MAFYSGNNATINVAGSNIITAKAGGLAFYNHASGSTVTGKYNITAPSSLKVEAGGMLLYAKVNFLVWLYIILSLILIILNLY